MSVDKFINFYVHHLSFIIEALFLAILIFVALYIYLSIRAEKHETVGMQGLGHLEDLIKKALERSTLAAVPAGGAPHLVDDDDTNLEKVAAPTSGAAPAPEETKVVAETKKAIEVMSVQVGEKDKKIEELSSQISDLQAQVQKSKQELASSVDTKALEIKIKDLESKLAEYEIIEDDIANLSLYKEENVRLKDELNKLKGAGGATPSVPEADLEIPAVDATAGLEALGSDIMAEFQAAVESQDSATKAMDVAIPESEPTAAAAVEPAKVAVTEPKVEAKTEEEVPSALKVDLNADTVLNELEAFEKSGVQAQDDGQDEGAKLIAEFENFMENKS